jgi:CPA2 family monovalent cation:H+ antiporter-2
VGELSFVLIQVASNGGLLTVHLNQLLTSASVLTLVLCPFLVGAAPRWGRSLAKRIVPARKLALEERQQQSRAKRLSGHVVVVGFGEAGRSAAASLADVGLDVVVLETDRRLMQAIRDAGCHALLGDGSQAEILEHARLPFAAGLVVALSDHRSTRLVVSQGRQLAPGIKIVARARYHLYRDEIAKAGADRIVDEESWVGRRLGEEMSLQLGEVWDHEGRDV